MANFESIEKLLITNGWQLVRIIGSHHQYMHLNTLKTITIPHSGKDELSVSILQHLESSTGLSFHG